MLSAFQPPSHTHTHKREHTAGWGFGRSPMIVIVAVRMWLCLIERASISWSAGNVSWSEWNYVKSDKRASIRAHLAHSRQWGPDLCYDRCQERVCAYVCVILMRLLSQSYYFANFLPAKPLTHTAGTKSVVMVWCDRVRLTSFNWMKFLQGLQIRPHRCPMPPPGALVTPSSLVETISVSAHLEECFKGFFLPCRLLLPHNRN